MHLTPEEQSIFDGDETPAATLAMRIVVEMGKLAGADRLVEILLQGAQCVYCAPMLARRYLRRFDGGDNLRLEHRAQISREQVRIDPKGDRRGSAAVALPPGQ